MSSRTTRYLTDTPLVRTFILHCASRSTSQQGPTLQDPYLQELLEERFRFLQQSISPNLEKKTGPFSFFSNLLARRAYVLSESQRSEYFNQLQIFGQHLQISRYDALHHHLIGQLLHSEPPMLRTDEQQDLLHKSLVVALRVDEPYQQTRSPSGTASPNISHTLTLLEQHLPPEHTLHVVQQILNEFEGEQQGPALSYLEHYFESVQIKKTLLEQTHPNIDSKDSQERTPLRL